MNGKDALKEKLHIPWENITGEAVFILRNRVASEGWECAIQVEKVVLREVGEAGIAPGEQDQHLGWEHTGDWSCRGRWGPDMPSLTVSWLGLDILRFPGGSVVNVHPTNAGDTGSIPGSGRSSGRENGSPLQYSCLENPMDRGAWWATVLGVAKRWTWLSD